MAQNIFSQLAQQTLSTATTPAGGGAAGDDDPTSAITAVAQEHGVNPNFLLGLAQLETRGGKATIKGDGTDTRNLFNIKDFSNAGTGIRARDKNEGSNHRYRQYNSHDESVVDLVDLLGRKYPGALEAKTPEEFAAALKRGRYATDPDYVRKLSSTIRSVQAKGGTPAPAPAPQWDQGARYVPMEQLVPGGPPARNPNKNPDFLRGAGDVGLSFLQGAAGSVKSLTDLAGAGNAVSRVLDDTSKELGKLKSEEAQQSLAYHQKKIKDAEASGDWKQEIAAYGDMVWDMPGDSLAQALGSLITLGAGKTAQALKLALSARKAGMTKEAFLKTAQGVEAAKKASNLGAGVNLGLGVGQGVGGVKGEQYERTYNAAKEEGLADDEAQALATEAQSYGKGWMQQAAGAALGYAAAKTGPLEKLASGQTVGAGGVLRRFAGGTGIESLTEGGQGAQARYAGNTAAIDAGVLDESQRFAGVAGTAFSEGLLGGMVGGGAGALGRPDVDPLATTKEAAKKPNSPISRAAVAGQPAKPEQQPAQTPVAAGAGAQSHEADPTFAEMSDSVLLQLQRSLQERQAAGDEDITDDEIELAQAAKAEYNRRMASAPPAVPGSVTPPQPTTPQTNEAPAQPAGVSASEKVQPTPAKAQPAITVDLNPAPRAPSPFDAVLLEQDPAITQQQREDAAKVRERHRKNMAALRLGVYNNNPMMEFLGRHGLQPETQNEFAPGTTERRKASVYGYGPVFRQNGKPLDLLLSNAKDEGFLPPDASESDLYDLVARAINGERVEPLYKAGSADALMQRLAAEREAKEAASYEDFLAQQQALAADPDYDPFATFADTENDYDVSDLDNSGYSQAEKSLQAEVSALAQAYSQLGFDADDVLEPLAIQYENNPDEYYAQARQRLTQLIAQATQPRGNDNLPQDSGEQTQAPIGREAASATSADDDALIDYAIEDDGEPDYFLQAQTARQLREREEAIAEQASLNAERQQALEAKAQADDERKRIEQASVQAADTFELGQNALDNLTGQTDLLAQMPAVQAESPAPAATQPTAQPQDGDILSDNGKPFTFEYGAKLRAKKDGGEVVQVAGGWAVRPKQGEATQSDPVAGDKIDDEWTAFSAQSGTLGIPRAEMPQVKTQDRGAMVNFLKARGIDSSNEVMPARAIKPTQAEFSPAKVQEAADRQDGERSIIVSADGYVVDGHHQWMAQRQKGEPVKVIKLDQPIGDVLQALKGMPSAQPEQVQNSVLQQMQDIKAELDEMGAATHASFVQDYIDDGDASDKALQYAREMLDGGREWKKEQDGSSANDADKDDWNQPRTAAQRQADAVRTLKETSNAFDALLAMHGDGMDADDDVIAIIQRASEGFTADYKRKLNKFLKENTRQGKNGIYIANKRRFFDLLPEQFGTDSYLLTNAIQSSTEATPNATLTNEGNITPEGLPEGARLETANRGPVQGMVRYVDSDGQPLSDWAEDETDAATQALEQVQSALAEKLLRDHFIAASNADAARSGGDAVEMLRLADERDALVQRLVDAGYTQAEIGANSLGLPVDHFSRLVKEGIYSREHGARDNLFPKTSRNKRKPAQQQAAATPEGLPKGAHLDTGTKGAAKGMVRYVDANGDFLSNWEATEADALKGAKKHLDWVAANAEKEKRFQENVVNLKRKALAGERMTDSELESIGIRADGSEFTYMSAAIQRLLDIPRHKVREAMGDAITIGQGMYGGEKQFVQPRKAITNAVQWLERQNQVPNDLATPQPDALALEIATTTPIPPKWKKLMDTKAEEGNADFLDSVVQNNATKNPHVSAYAQGLLDKVKAKDTPKFAAGDQVRIKGEEQKLHTIDQIGKDGWVYLKSGGAFPPEKAAEYLFKSEPKPSNATFGGSLSSLEDRTPSYAENMSRWRNEAGTSSTSQPDTSNRADSGGQVGMNGYFYKGGQFLPNTMAEPGKWKLGGKWVTGGREETAPYQFGYTPTPFSRSIYSMVRGWLIMQDGKLALRDGIRENDGSTPVTLNTEVRPGVRGVVGKESLTVAELIDAWNSGQRWFDVKPDTETITTQTEPQAQQPTQPTIDTSPAAKWRNNWGEAKRTAESLGLPVKDGKRNLKLTEMVPAIEAKLARQQMAAAAPDSTQVKAAESVPQQTDTPLARAEAELADWKARRNLPANAGNVADVDKEINRLEQTVTALKKIEQGDLAQNPLMQAAQDSGKLVMATVGDKKQPTQTASKLDAAAAALDAEIEAAGAELAALFKRKSGQLNSGVDPEILMAGAKLGALYTAKGVVKFAQWARAIVSHMQRLGVDPDMVKPALKEIYAATAQRVDDATFDLMDDARAVRGFDLSTLDAQPDGANEALREIDNAVPIEPQQENANDADESQGNDQIYAEGSAPSAIPANGQQRRVGAVPSEPDRAVPRERSGRPTGGAEPGGGRTGAGQRPADDLPGDRERGAQSDGRASQLASDYRIRPGELKRTGSWKATAEQNVRIVELVKQITAEGRQATPEEQALLTKFTGWGASEIANGIFPNQYGNYKPEWRELGERLKAALTPEEYAQAKRTTQYAHYTSEPIIRSVYRALDRMGFNGGQVLEPGMGVGLFNGLMPDAMASNTLYTGIEYDSITGNIARLLYPASNIVVGDFTATKLARDFFDAAIGNPPFGQIKIQSDPEYKKQGFLLHDYFFAKTIDRVKPGGLLVFVTSKGTMDKATDRARKYLSERADLVGAIRLPQTAFKDNAGTEVVTDVIFLKKRAEGQEPAGQAWQGLAEVQTAQGPAYVNEYFAAHPEMVLGRHAKTGSMYRADEYTVEPIEGDIEQLFAKAVQNLPENIYRPQRGSKAERAAVQRRDYDPKIKKEGGIYVADDGTLMQVDSGQGVPLTSRENSAGKVLQLKPREIEWLKGYAGVRDALKQAQYDQLNDGPWEKSLKALNKAYDAFTKEHGPILAHTITERENDDGSVTVTRRYKNEPLIRLDAEGALVHALESINTDGTISKQAVLNGRTLNKPVTPTITSAQDAMFVSLNETGRFDMANISKLAGKTEAEVIAELGTAIYEDPSAGWTTADAYLSGNVVRKLKEAESAARIDKRYERNVEALKNVQPRALAPQDITVQLGSAWVPATDVMSFAAEVMGDTLKVSRSPVTGQWSVDGNSSRVSEWGTGDKKPTDILEGVLNNRQLKVTYRDSEGKTHTDAEATEKVNDIAKKLRREFKRWVWSDAQRADRLAKFYNENYNNIAPRQFDGSHLTLPGVSSRFNLRPHQKRAIWRTIQQGDTYYAHAVGAGKTFTMIAAGMEERRLGLAKKPMYVVPNHMLAQFSKEFLELYPTASIMVADETNFHTHNRRKFVAQAALNDPDAIVITHSAFGRIGMSPEYTAQFIKGQIYDWKDALQESDKNDRVTRKQIERRIEQLENRLKGIIDGKKDQLLSFEELGVDRLYVDEGHEFRKLDFPTNRGNIKGIDPSGSQRSMDLYMKVQYLRQKNPGRALVMASGTPVTNTMGELFTVQRFFQPTQLEEDGDNSFDAWAGHYGEVVDGLEQNAAGGYETVSRFAKFVNVPELMSRVRTFMDILTSNQLGDLVQRPDVNGGGRKVVVTPVPDGYKEYQKRLDARIKAIRNRKGPPQPGDDIILSVISDGRFSAIDMRFVDPTLPSDPNSKLNVTIDEMIRAYKDSQSNEYATGGKADELKGGSLMLFTDIGLGEQSARSRGFDMKAWIEKRLVEGGVKPEHIAFMRDHKAHAKKERLFDDMRQGRKRILIGGKDMETGVNAQKRLVWLGHLDAPWFPASVEQREGRIIRQGNQNKAVDVKAFATKGSYDSTMWGMNSRKARFIEQAMSGDTSVRSMEDVSEASAFEMAAALASGDERYMKLAGLKADVERLNRLYSAHMDDQKRLRGEKMTAESSIKYNREQIDQINAALAKREPIKAGEFRAQVGGVTFGKREEFSVALYGKFKELAEAYTEGEQQLGTIGGFPIRYLGMKLRDGNFIAELSLDLPGDNEPLAVFPTEVEFSVAGIATRAANQVNGLERELAKKGSFLSEQAARLEKINRRLGAAFPEQSELNEKREALGELEKELEAESKANESAQAQADDEPAEGATAFSRRTASGNQLPNAIVVHKLGDLNNHPDYAAANGGDLEAALRIADDMVDDAMVEKVRTAAGNAELVVPVVSVEASGRNKIPRAVAEVLAEKLGVSAATEIAQVNSPKRTAMDGLSRLLSPPVFDGPVQPGAAYVLVDDALTQGGTFAALASHIIDNGGTVSGVVALTGKQYSVKLAPSPELLSQVRERFQSVEDDFRAATGYGFDALTESEARYLAKHDNAQSVRDRIVEAGRSASVGLDQVGSGSPQGIKASRSSLTTPVTNTGLPTARVEAVVRQLQSGWNNAPTVVVVQDLQDPRVPQVVRDENTRQVAAGAQGVPDGFIHGETVYLVANQMGSPADAARVLLHETLGHHGLRGVFGDTLSPILRDLANKRRREVVTMAIRQGLKPDTVADNASVADIYQAMTPAQREQAAEEVLAYMAQNQPELGFVRRAIAAIRQWLKSTFPALGERLALTDGDIVANYILPARAFVESGRPRVQAHRTAKAQSNLMDVLAALDESGVVDINC